MKVSVGGEVGNRRNGKNSSAKDMENFILQPLFAVSKPCVRHWNIPGNRGGVCGAFILNSAYCLICLLRDWAFVDQLRPVWRFSLWGQGRGDSIGWSQKERGLPEESTMSAAANEILRTSFCFFGDFTSWLLWVSDSTTPNYSLPRGPLDGWRLDTYVESGLVLNNDQFTLYTNQCWTNG